MASGNRSSINVTSTSTSTSSTIHFKSSSSAASTSSIKSSFSSSATISSRMRALGLRSSGNDQNTENTLIKEIYEQFLNCKLCFKAFIRPKTLNCLHTFCEECLVRHREAELESARYVSYSMRSRLVCPICSKKTDLPPGGIRRLQDSILLSDLNQIVSRVLRSSKPSLTRGSSFNEEESDAFLEGKGTDAAVGASEKLWCGICRKTSDDELSTSCISVNSNAGESSKALSVRGSRKNSRNFDSGDSNETITLASEAEDDQRKEATVECLDCSAKLLCRDCADMHMATEVTQNHSLVDIGLARRGKLQCAEHTQEIVRFFCDTCDKCICVLCTFNDHKTHKITTFSDSIKLQIQVLEGRFERCKSNLETMKEHLDIITQFESKVLCAEELIREKSSELIKMVKEKEEETIFELKATLKSSEVANFLGQKPRIEEALTDIENTFSFTEDLLKNKNVEIILMKKNLEEKMKHLLDWTAPSVPEKLTAPLVFIPQQFEVHLGTLKTKDSYPEGNEASSSSSTEEVRSDKSSSDVVEPTSISENDFSSESSSRESSSSSQQSKNSENGTANFSEVKITGGKTSDLISDELYQVSVISEPSRMELKLEKRKNEIIENHSSEADCSDAPVVQNIQLFFTMVDQSTNTDIFTRDEKSTLTDQTSVQVVNKGVSTITLLTSDKGVGTTNTTVSSAYMEFVETKLPKHVAVSRGTMTTEKVMATAEPNDTKKCDRATSPIQIICLDKATMANKAELAEPRDVFCRPGMEQKPKKIIESIPVSARLDSINEGSDEDRSSGEENKNDTKALKLAKFPILPSTKTLNRMTTLRPLPNLSSHKVLSPNSAVVHPLAARRSNPLMGDKFKPAFPINGRLTPLRCHAEIGTNTESFSTLDKSTGTDSPPIFEKMAECISKLKTVRHRLECIQSPINPHLEGKDLMPSSVLQSSDISVSISSSFETATSDNDNGMFSKSRESGDSFFSAKDVKKYILSVDAGGTSATLSSSRAAKSKNLRQPASPVTTNKRQRTPCSTPSQSGGGNDLSNSSGGSSTSNSPSVQRSGKATSSSKSPNENSLLCKSPKFVREKPKLARDSTEQKLRQNSAQSVVRHKLLAGLADLSDSVNSESSEEQDRCGSGESFAGLATSSAAEGDRAVGANLKQRLVKSPLATRKTKKEVAPLFKSLSSGNKSPRPQRKY